MRPLSERQQRILEFIAVFQERHGYPPTVREIGQAADISSTSVVDYNLRVLERLGYLRRDPDVSRGLELQRGPGTAAQRRGRIHSRCRSIAAGATDRGYCLGHPEELRLSGHAYDARCFALKVKGKSMIEDLIDDGDIVVVRSQETADDGDIVVALADRRADARGNCDAEAVVPGERSGFGCSRRTQQWTRSTSIRAS